MSTENRQSFNMLPPISMFAPRSPPYIMPASPPTCGHDKSKSLPILPKPQVEFFPLNEMNSPPSNPVYADQNTLWALFNQFQQQQKTTLPIQESNKTRRASDPATSATERVLSSEEVLAEKRRKNAGASARFRDRRKRREKELQDRCTQLEQRAKDLENALKCFNQDHPLLSETHDSSFIRQKTPNFTEQNTLFDRVGQLENLMTRFKQEKETDVQKLDELEKENKYLRSLLIHIQLPENKEKKRSRSLSISKDDGSPRTRLN